MKFLVGIAVKLVAIVISLTVVCTASSTISEHFGTNGESHFTKTISRMIDEGLSLLPDSIEIGAKSALTALDGAVSNMTKMLIERMSP